MIQSNLLLPIDFLSRFLFGPDGMISDCEMDISDSESTKEAEANRQKRLRSTEAENPAKVRKLND